MMNKLRLLTIIILLTGISASLHATQIDEASALAKAQRFYHQKNSSLLRSAPDFQLIYTCKDTTSFLKSGTASTYFYIYNVGNGQGFVIVSGDDAAKTILGYSDEGSFSLDHLPANLQSWLDFYKSEIQYAIANGLSTTPLDTAATVQLRTASSVAPLLGNIKWNQSDPYNILCPKISGELTVTGCVATAMAQIMKFYQWPAKGTGSNTYTSVNCGSLTADFSITNYDWTNMSESYGTSSTTAQNTAVATLMYHCGVAVDMNYNTGAKGGSSASMNKAGIGLIKYFGYDSDLQSHSRYLYSAAEWENRIKAELDVSRPVFYSGHTEDSGHAFVCDGYDNNNLYHINWGWGGMSNGYFELSSLQPSATGIGGSVGGYSQSQTMITGIKKPDGVTNTTYEFGIWDKGLTPSTTTLSNIRTGSLNLNYGILNNGVNLFSGNIGVGLYKDGVFQKELKTTSVSLNSNYGFKDIGFNSVSLSDLTPGNYQIYCIYKASNAATWSVVKNTASTNNYVNVVISGTGVFSASVQTPSIKPSLALAQAIQQTGNAYLNRTADFSLTVQNTGSEFYSNIGVRLVSTTNPLVSQIVKYGVVCIPAGETKTFSLSGDITCTPGYYYATAIFDSTNTCSSVNFKEFGPITFSQLPVTVNPEPTAALLNLTQKISLLNPNVYRNEAANLHVSIQNTGGFFNSDICAFVFPSGWGNSVGRLNSETANIETNETKAITLTGTLDLAPGTYHFVLYQNNGSWVELTPNTFSRLDFTLFDQATGLEDANNSDLTIYPNPVKNQININTSQSILQAQVSDLSGRIILNVCNARTIQVGHLKTGVYFLRMETERGIKTVKFIKD